MTAKVVALIPARGGSKGLPRKNIRQLCGRPLIAYTIESAKRSRLVNRVIVSTEDEEIAGTARECGAETPFLRPPELAQDLTPTEPVLQHALEWLEKNEKFKTDIIVFLQPTDIFRTPGLIDKAISVLIENPEMDSCFAAYPSHKNYWRKKDGAWVKLAPDLAYGPRQKKEKVYREDTGIACATRASVIRAGRRIGDKIQILPYGEPEAYIDVEDELTFFLAEKVVERWGSKFWPELTKEEVGA